MANVTLANRIVSRISQGSVYNGPSAASKEQSDPPKVAESGSIPVSGTEIVGISEAIALPTSTSPRVRNDADLLSQQTGFDSRAWDMANREIDTKAKLFLADRFSYWDDEEAIDWYGYYDKQADKLYLYASEDSGESTTWVVQLIPD